MIYLNTGTAAPDFASGKDDGANSVPGEEWNVAFDMWTFVRLLCSNLPIALYPSAAQDGTFVLDKHSTFGNLPNLKSIRRTGIKLQRHLTYSFEITLSYDFLRGMDIGEVADSFMIARDSPSPHHVWETAAWLRISKHRLVKREGHFQIILKNELKQTDEAVSGRLVPCEVAVHDDGKFVFKETKKELIFQYT